MVILIVKIRLEKRDNCEEAISYLKRALDIDPNSELIKEKIKNLKRKVKNILIK